MDAKIVFKEVAIEDVKEGDTIKIQNRKYGDIQILENIDKSGLDYLTTLMDNKICISRAEIEVDKKELKKMKENLFDEYHLVFFYDNNAITEKNFEDAIDDLLTNLGVNVE